MARIFLSYRREDGRHVAERIYDRLRERFGRKNVFKDVGSIRFGADFREVIQEAIGDADVLVVVIGTKWSQLRDERDVPRLSNADDPVRVEIETAFARDIPVLPVLVDHSSMPAEKDLPDSLKSFAFRNAAPVRPDPDFAGDIDRLIEAIHLFATHDADEHLRVLLIDEDPLNRKMAAAVVTSQRHACVAAGNPPDAIEAMAHGRFDLVLAQAHMIESDAFELVASLREKTPAGACPPIIVGMTNDAEWQSRCLERGMDGVVSRPLTIPELQEVIARFLSAIDRDSLLSMAGANKELVHKMIQLFLADSPKLIVRIREALSVDDSRGVTSLAHAFKATLNIVAAHSARDLAQELESLSHAGNMAQARKVTDQLEESLKRARFSLLRILRDLDE